jgi:AraC-like DNA-binding protein
LCDAKERLGRGRPRRTLATGERQASQCTARSIGEYHPRQAINVLRRNTRRSGANFSAPERRALCNSTQVLPVTPLVTEELVNMREATRERRRALKQEAMTIITTEYAGVLRLHEVARRIGASNRGLQRALAEGGEGSFSQALRDRRLEVAARLLATSCLPISQVAERVGYSSAQHFTRAFRRRHGLPPRAFRQAARAGPESVRHEPSPERRAA